MRNSAAPRTNSAVSVKRSAVGVTHSSAVWVTDSRAVWVKHSSAVWATVTNSVFSGTLHMNAGLMNADLNYLPEFFAEAT